MMERNGPMFPERIDVLFSEKKLCTHRRIRKFLVDHEVIIGRNGSACRIYGGDVEVDVDEDKVFIDGARVEFIPDLYILMNKASGCLCTSAESGKAQGEKTVFDYLEPSLLADRDGRKIHTAGRLDRDTEGFLILTTDGKFSRRLASPETHVSKTYEVLLDRRISLGEQERWRHLAAEGFFICHDGRKKGFFSRPGLLEFHGEDKIFLTLSEGKFHQVKRMVSALGATVVNLKRISMGNLALDEDLAPGEYRFLSRNEIHSILGKSVYLN